MKKTVRHAIRVAEGTLVTIDDTRRVEVNYRKLRRLNTLAALEAAFAGMGFRLIKRTPDEVVYEKRVGANPMTKTCTVPGCDQPRMISRKGKPLTMCEAHQREYWREHKSRANGGKRGRPATPAAVPVLPPPNCRCTSASSRCAAPPAGSSSPTPTRCSMSRRMRASAAAARLRLR